MDPALHPDLARLTAFASGLLASEDAIAVEAHLLNCPECANRLAADEPADRLVEGVRSVLAESAWRSWGVPPPPPGPPATPGTLLAGRYRLLEPVGEGGMGAVWKAEQEQPVRRIVAVKLIKAGMDSKAVMARFETERQTLAIMDHPNIARVLDGGLTDEGRPFFVMELVTGVPITKYCDQHKLLPRERLELFIPVCRAIQHAHQKGIIHRDIKPGNVLVTEYDGRPAPKVIDFGVAKATAASLSGSMIATAAGGLIGTPEYMSPEQAGFGEQDIDTRSDVYALGVLLYELLAGVPPFTWNDLERRGLLEVLRVIREVDPPKPSTRLSSVSPAANNTSNDSGQITRLVRGDLDWITMKALEKDRDRRYATANSLAEDVARYLSGQPIEAAPPSLRYRAGKFVRRNRGPVLAASLLIAALVAGIVGTSLGLIRAETAEAEAREQARVANTERERANAAATAEREIRRLEWQTHFHDSIILAQLAEAFQSGNQEAMRRLLRGKESWFVGWIDQSKIDEPATLLQMRDAASMVAREMKNEEVAIHQGQAALKTSRDHFGPASGFTIRSLHRLADTYRAFNRKGPADDADQAAEAAFANLPPLLSFDDWHGRHALASYYANNRREDTPQLQRAIGLLENLMADTVHSDRHQHRTARHQLAWTYWYANRKEDAFRCEKQILLELSANSVESFEEQIVADAQQLFVNLNRIDAECWNALNRRLRRDRIHLGILALWSFDLLQRKEWKDAEPILRDLVAGREKLEPDLWTTFNARSMLGGSLLGQSRYGDALPHLLAGYEGMKRLKDKIPIEGKPRLREAAQRLIQLYEFLKQPQEADLYRKAAKE